MAGAESSERDVEVAVPSSAGRRPNAISRLPGGKTVCLLGCRPEVLSYPAGGGGR